MDKRKKVFSVFGVKKEKRKAIDRSKFFKEKSSSQLVVPFEIFLQSSYIYIYRVFLRFNNLLDFRIVVATISNDGISNDAL